MRALDDTIAAVATAPGQGGIAIVRLSGPGAKAVAERLLLGRAGLPVELASRGLQWARICDPQGRPIDEGLVLWMPGPSSYTREDVLEFQCHGGQAAALAILEAVLASGARLAEPGEFTLRAFLRGRVDLVQAEAVLDTIEARTAEALRIHGALLEGRLSAEVASWQELLGEALALVETELDFSEEEVPALEPAALAGRLDSVRRTMERKLETYAWGRVCREGYRVALVGSPNVGKSSLLNALAGEERAIVSGIPGTTRDAIEVGLNACGAPVRIVDTAGLRRGGDEVEEEGVRRARKAASGADLVLFVCDGGRPLRPEEEEELRRLDGAGVLPVVNKVDLGREPVRPLRDLCVRGPVEVSARTGEGIDALLLRLREAAWAGGREGPEAPLTRGRHRDAVERAKGCVERATSLLENGGYPEVVAAELHAARRALAELLGWGSPEDVLDRIFADFCIGK